MKQAIQIGLIMAKTIGTALAVIVIYAILREVSIVTAVLFIIPVLVTGIIMVKKEAKS